MMYSKEQQVGTKKSKNPGKIKSLTSEAASRNAKYSAVLEEIDQEREPICQGCEKPEFQHSHSIPRAYNDYAFMCDKRNIWRLCHDCHTIKYENGRVWLLKCGQEIMENILLLDEAYYRRKLEQVRKRLEGYKKTNWLSLSNGSVKIPAWVENLVGE
jgi:hypothetical protein